MWEANSCVYGVRKIWRQLGREGIGVARCTVARLLRAQGLQGAIRGKPMRATVSDKATLCSLDRWLGVSRTAYAGFMRDVLEQALHARRPVHHSDRGPQCLARRCLERPL